MHGVTLDPAFLEMVIRKRLEQTAEDLRQRPTETEALRQLDAIAGLLPDFPFEINLRTVQNIYYHILKEILPQKQKEALGHENNAEEWVDIFQALGAKIGMRTQ